MRTSAFFPCSMYPANRQWNQPQPNEQRKSSTGTCARGCKNVLLMPDEVLSCRAGELKFALHGQLWHCSCCEWSGGHRWPCCVTSVSLSLVVMENVQDKADGESRKTVFEKPVGEEIACSSYQHRWWAQLACNSYLKNVSSSGGNLHRISFPGLSLCDKC